MIGRSLSSTCALYGRTAAKTLQPLGRVANVSEIVDAVLYLISAEFTIGQVLAVDGGMSTGK
ncbi:SDR family oxidoreductase [Pseudomonas sp. 6D_7.1_Bac1]|uniref:SDR family oxidoreductase n=1 Tax=Pseudomonas sp. 6D_7.1_Bac1 TaxID=2971615 RepID=UPI0021CA552F|nr:SDR family oxidoreductase [Pseudomonas sp. 6D_7.1_Bac1]MCU1750946.1 SDR family oxidoreductase [Pseudomonas sp. 6D_7.1_Bac1]